MNSRIFMDTKIFMDARRCRHLDRRAKKTAQILVFVMLAVIAVS